MKLTFSLTVVLGILAAQKALAAEAVGMSILQDGQHVAGFTITYDGQTEAELWMMLKEIPLTFERDFEVPVDPEDGDKATLSGSIEVHAKRRGTPGSKTTVETVRILRQGPDRWVMVPQDVERTLKAAGLAIPVGGPSPRAIAEGVASWMFFGITALFVGVVGAGFLLIRQKPAAD